MAKSRKVDMLSAATKTAARSEYMSFSPPHIELPGVIIVRGEENDFPSLDHLRGKKVGVVSGYVWQEWITRDHPDIKLQPVPDMQTGLLLVSFGQLDAMVGNLATATHQLTKLGVTNLRVAGQTGYFARLALASRKDWPELTAILEKGVKAITPDEHKKILDQWIGLAASDTLDARTILIGVLILLGVIALAIGGSLVWNYSLGRMVRRQNASLRESEERYRQLVDLSPQAAIVYVDSKLVYTNQAFLNQVGASSLEDVIGKTADDFIHPDDREAVSQRRTKALTGDRAAPPSQMRRLRLDGTDYYGEGAAAPFLWNGQRAVQVVCRDITDQRKAEAALLSAKDEAELANRTKSEFLASMSHELRTPLNAIIGFSQIMHNEALGPVGSPQYREYAGDIMSSGEHLLSLINDVLDISKIEADKADLYEETVNLPGAIQSCMTLIRERAEAAGIILETNIEPDAIPSLYADPRRIKQILINLLSNAVKFTHTGGTVTVTARFRPDIGYVMQCTDTGVGIAPDDIPKALARFQQIDGTLERQHEGTGLGLPLAKSLAALHGGSLNLTSELGVGTTVTVTLPATRRITQADVA